MRLKLFLWVGFLCMAVISGCGGTEYSMEESIPASESVSARSVQVINGQGTTVGKVVLTEEKNGVRLHVEGSGLQPGKHGFHIHENRFEGADFKSAGSHFNPTGNQHGLENPHGSHVGDMKNLMVKPDGSVKQTEFLPGATLKKGMTNSLLGRSIIIHAGVDDQLTDPSGNSGDRIAGGVIPE